MGMTFKDYINNPMGEKNSVFTQREALRSVYVEKFNKVMVREMGDIKVQLYTNDDKYIAYLKIPSEVIEKFYYDVVIEFNPPNIMRKMEKTLDNYDVKFFSNDPAFVFTFAYAFNKHKLFISDLEPRMSKTALEDKAKVKNPTASVGYVKSLYFAFLYMKAKGLFLKSMYETYGKPYNLKSLLQQIMPAEDKISARTEAQVLLIKRNNLERHRKIAEKNNAREFNSDNVRNTPIVKAIKRTSTVKHSKVTKAKGNKK